MGRKRGLETTSELLTAPLQDVRRVIMRSTDPTLRQLSSNSFHDYYSQLSTTITCLQLPIDVLSSLLYSPINLQCSNYLESRRARVTGMKSDH